MTKACRNSHELLQKSQLVEEFDVEHISPGTWDVRLVPQASVIVLPGVELSDVTFRRQLRAAGHCPDQS